MKTTIDKDKLTYLSTEKYNTLNVNVKAAHIVKYLYDEREIRYQPQIENAKGRVLIDRCCYIQKDEAKKAIDNYTI